MGEVIDRTKGKIKRAVGNLTGNKRLERQGKRDEGKARFEGAINDVKDAANDVHAVVKDAKDAVKDAVK